MPVRRLRRRGFDASPQVPEYRGFPGLRTESPAAGAVRFPASLMRAGHGFCRKRHFHFGFRAVNRLRPLRGAGTGRRSAAPGDGRWHEAGRRGARGGGSRKTTRSGRHVMVVESPVKARTIGGYLGREYRVIATRGHVRDLPAKAGSVKPEDGFAMLTETGRRAARTLAAVANALANAETLVLATDPDREGEAIAWQVLSWLAERGAIGEKPVHRVAFHEVTPAAVRTALARPRDIDMDLVRAWQARRALDYLVGYGLSPILWRKLPGCRSAGRVQSVALRLVCEREAEIEAFVPRQSWTVHAELAAADGVPFPATLCRLDGSAVGEEGLAMEELAQETAKRIGESRLAVLSVERDTLRRRPLPPFTTSTLQQEALQRLGFGIGETMDIAQRLYEACIVIARHYEIHVPFFSAIPEPHLPRMSGPLGNPTYLSVCMLFNLLLALGFAVRAWLPGTEPALATALPVPARRGGQGRRRREAAGNAGRPPAAALAGRACVDRGCGAALLGAGAGRIGRRLRRAVRRRRLRRGCRGPVGPWAHSSGRARRNRAFLRGGRRDGPAPLRGRAHGAAGHRSPGRRLRRRRPSPASGRPEPPGRVGGRDRGLRGAPGAGLGAGELHRGLRPLRIGLRRGRGASRPGARQARRGRREPRDRSLRGGCAGHEPLSGLFHVLLRAQSVSEVRVAVA